MTNVIIGNFVALSMQELVEIEKEFVTQLFYELVNTTPVDTGLARASWSINREGTQAEKLDPGNYGLPDIPDLSFMGSKMSNVMINNTADHISILNEGWSKQAPAKFIEKAVDKIVGEFS